MTDLSHEQKVDALLAEAKAGELSQLPSVSYFASWLVFYIEQHRKLERAWQESIDRMLTR